VNKKAIFVANTGFSLFNFRLPLMKRLSDLGWSVVGAASDEAAYASKFAKEGIKFINVSIDHKGMNPFADLALISKLKSLYEKETPNLVHHFTIKPVIFGSLAAKWANVPAIVNSITGLGYVFVKGGLLKRIVIELYKLALSRRTQIIFQNKNDKQLFLDNDIVKDTNARVILGSGVNTDQIRPLENNTQDGGLKFLLISRMLWTKGVSEYVGAAEKVKRDFPETSFIMAGGASGGGAQGNPEAIPEKWLQDVTSKGSVQWVGRIPHKEVMALLDDSDVVVLPSYYPEGVPKSLIEAAAKGKTIITTDTPGCREVVIDGVNGFLVQPKDVDSLVNAMHRLIREPGIVNQMGAASRKRAVELFDEKKVLNETLIVYQEAGALLREWLKE